MTAPAEPAPMTMVSACLAEITRDAPERSQSQPASTAASSSSRGEEEPWGGDDGVICGGFGSGGMTTTTVSCGGASGLRDLRLRGGRDRREDMWRGSSPAPYHDRHRFRAGLAAWSWQFARTGAYSVRAFFRPPRRAGLSASFAPGGP